MTDAWNLWPVEGWQRFAADAAWQGLVIVILTAVAMRVVRRRPAMRAALALGAILMCVVAPVASGVARWHEWGMLSRESVDVAIHNVEALPAPAESPVAIPAKTATVASVPADASAPANDRSARLLSITGVKGLFAAAWILASVALAVRLAAGARALRRMCRGAESCPDAELHGTLARAARAVGVEAPRLCRSPYISTPALVGLGRPCLIVPAKAASNVDWFAVFCHELAHLARRDGEARLAVELVTVLLPWQPAVWLLRRQFRAACEEACDDWAVAQGADPVEFASLLLSYVPEARSALALGMSESVSSTRGRIMRLLAMQSTPNPRLGVWAGLSGWIIAIALAVSLALFQYGRGPWGGGSELPPWGDVPAALAAKNVSAADQPLRKPYVVDVPDILLIDAQKVVPKPPYHIEPQDKLEIFVMGTLPDQNIAGPYNVGADGTIALGPAYGTIKVSNMTLADARQAISAQLESALTAPEVSVSLSESAGQQEIKGEHLVGPDGTINLGSYGSVYVAGMTVAEVRKAVESHLADSLDNPQVSVDVYAFNSKFYYVVTEREGEDFINRIPCTGRERVLDALSQVANAKLSTKSWVWIARPSAAGDNGDAKILPVDWRAIFRGESSATNYWIEPGDRIFVQER